MKSYVTWIPREPNWPEVVIFAESAGKARYKRLRDVREYYDEATFADIRVRAVNATPYDSNFARNAAYRRIPEAKIGMRIEVEGDPGIITGHNSSANLNVYFTGGKHKGLTLNCHPNWMMRYFREDGSVLYDFATCTFHVHEPAAAPVTDCKQSNKEMVPGAGVEPPSGSENT